MQDNYNITKIKEVIENGQKIVIFTGAGISVPSGIPDFRSASGIYNQKLNSNITPEQIISHTFFMTHPDDFYQFYFDKMVYEKALPNVAHQYFGNLKNVTGVITQNIDGLHQMGGPNPVYELHGSIHRNYCMKCHKFYDLKGIMNQYQLNKKVPYCECGGMIKPDVVLYEENLDDFVINKTIRLISECDVLIVIGTSLVVYPAASFIQYYQGNKLILINKSITPYDNIADYVIHDDVINVVKQLNNL